MRCLLMLLAACSGGSDSAAPAAVALEALPGVSVDFDPAADLTADFYALPWPLDHRLTADGHPDLTGLPAPVDHPPIDQLLSLVAEADRWSQVPTVLFRFEEDVAPAGLDDGPVDPTRAAFLLVDPDHPDAGRLVPAFAATPPQDPYAPAHALVLQPVHGFILDADTTWAAVVFRDFGDADGGALGVPLALREALRGGGPLGDDFALLSDHVDDLDAVAAAAVFTTGDAVGQTRAFTEAVRAAHAPELRAFALDPDDGADHARFCEVHALLDVPQFQQGTPPFDTQGTFVWDGADLPPVRTVEAAPVALALPRGTMPADGWPVVVYAHGSGGAFDQVIDRGPTLEPDGERQVGLGPAHVLAGRGIAAVGMATLLSPDREGGETGRGYLNLLNLAAYRDTWRQGIADTRLLLDALESAEIPPEALEGCGAALPEGATAHVFDTRELGIMGQSAGAHLSMEVAALDERVKAVVPTGAGGFWSLVMTTNPRQGVPPDVTAVALGTPVTPDAMHPGLAFLQMAWEPAEPAVYAPRISEQPLPGHAPRDVYLPASQDDGYFPQPIYDALVLATGLELTGDALWPEMGARLDLGGLTDRPALPATANRGAWTGLTQQWAPDGIIDSHSVFAQYDGIKHQYGCFFRTRIDAGVATLVAPGDETDPCQAD